MPSGEVHLDLWKKFRAVPITVSIILFPTVYYLHGVWVCWDWFCLPLSLFSSLGILAGYFVIGYFIDPDADLVGISSAEGRMLRKIPILGILFVAYWTGYGGFFRGKHRSFWTHSYIFSTFLRYLYGFWWSFLFFRELLGIYVFLGVFTGMCISDAIHVWADKHYGDK